MKKNSVILILLFIFLVQCGYKPIFSSNQKNFTITDMVYLGDSKINSSIKNTLDIYKERQNEDKIYNLEIFTKFNKNITSKNSKGDPSSFVIEISLDLKVFENNKLLITKNFLESFNYNNTSQKFELKQYEEEIKKKSSK